MQDNIVKKVCKDLGITQKELAERLGVSKPTIERWSAKGDIPLMAQKYLELLLEHQKLIEKYETIKKAHQIIYDDIQRG